MESYHASKGLSHLYETQICCFLTCFSSPSPSVVQRNWSTSLFHAYVIEVHSRKKVHWCSAPEHRVMLMDNFLFTETPCKGDLLVHRDRSKSGHNEEREVVVNIPV